LQLRNWNSIEKFAFDMWEDRAKTSLILQDLPAEAQKDWNTMNFKVLDGFLRKHCKKITCGDVSAIYWKFWWDLKKIKSNSTNFVGYSELLITRLLLHLLKIDYCSDNDPDCYSTPNPDSPSDDLGHFVLSKRDLILATEIIPEPFRADLGKRRPDLILFDRRNKKIFSIVQVKSYPASADAVKSDLKFIDEVTRKYTEIKGLIFIFYGCMTLFDAEPRICKLYENNTKIADVFRDKLGLDRLKGVY
jgi:hypothetical protein